MKNNSYEVCSWPSFLGPGLMIDWELIKKISPPGMVDWLQSKPLVECQLVLEKEANSSKLLVEFFNSATEVEYCLRWAK